MSPGRRAQARIPWQHVLGVDRLGAAEQAELAGRIRRAGLGTRLAGRLGNDVDDRAPAPLAHRRQEGLHHPVGPCGWCRSGAGIRRAPGLRNCGGGCWCPRHRPGRRRVRRRPGSRRPWRRQPLRWRGHRETRTGWTARGGGEPGGFFEGGRATAEDGDAPSGPGERERGGAADAGAGAGDDRRADFGGRTHVRGGYVEKEKAGWQPSRP